MTLMKDNVPIGHAQGVARSYKKEFIKEIARAKDGSKFIEIVKKKKEEEEEEDY